MLYKTLEKDREERYQSMSDLRRDLEIINNALLGKAMISKGSLPGLAKLKRLPQARKFDMHPALLVAVACLAMVGTILGALALLNYLVKEQDAGAFKGTVPTYSGEPPLVWAKYHQAALRALENHNYDEAQALLELAHPGVQTNHVLLRTGTSLSPRRHHQPNHQNTNQQYVFHTPPFNHG